MVLGMDLTDDGEMGVTSSTPGGSGMSTSENVLDRVPYVLWIAAAAYVLWSVIDI